MGNAAQIITAISFLSALHLIRSYGEAASIPVRQLPEGGKVSLDRMGRYEMEWSVDRENETITFNVTAQTKGWVAFGFRTQDGSLNGDDYFIGGVDGRGQAYFGDFHTAENSSDVLRDRNDWVLLEARENGTHTSLTFSSRWNTGDPFDYVVTPAPVYILSAVGSPDGIPQTLENVAAQELVLLQDGSRLAENRRLQRIGNQDGRTDAWDPRRGSVPTDNMSWLQRRDALRNF